MNSACRVQQKRTYETQVQNHWPLPVHGLCVCVCYQLLFGQVGLLRSITLLIYKDNIRLICEECQIVTSIQQLLSKDFIVDCLISLNILLWLVPCCILQEDEDMYPELYRKSDYVKGSNEEVPPPYQIGRILEIFIKKDLMQDPDPDRVYMKINKFYRYCTWEMVGVLKAVLRNSQRAIRFWHQSYHCGL